jgi:hypothetical protein
LPPTQPAAKAAVKSRRRRRLQAAVQKNKRRIEDRGLLVSFEARGSSMPIFDLRKKAITIF